MYNLKRYVKSQGQEEGSGLQFWKFWSSESIDFEENPVSGHVNVEKKGNSCFVL